MKRPSIPSRLKGSHPRRADGRFLSRAAARAQVTRLTRAATKSSSRRSTRPIERVSSKRPTPRPGPVARVAQPSAERVGIRRRGNVRSEAARKGWETRRANARARTRAAKKGHQTRRIIGEAQTFLSEGIDQPLVYHNAPSAITEPIRDVDSLEELLDYFENVDGFDDWIDYEAETNAGYEED